MSTDAHQFHPVTPSASYPIAWSDGQICESLPTSTHMALNLGIFVLYIPLSCISSACNLLFLNLGVQLFSHVPPVTVWMVQ